MRRMSSRGIVIGAVVLGSAVLGSAVLAGGVATAGTAVSPHGTSALRAGSVVEAGSVVQAGSVVHTGKAPGNPAGNAYVPKAGRAVVTTHPNHVIGQGTPASCTSAAVVKAVAAGGVITFNCGKKPVTIKMTATAKVVNTSRLVVLDGGGKVTLDGGSKVRILYMNTCDQKQKWTTSSCWQQELPKLIVQNLTFQNAYSATQQTSTSTYGGGAIFDEGGQLKVVNSTFTNDRCYASGPDLGGGAIRALGMWKGNAVYITRDTFAGNSCSNGAALSGLFAHFAVYNSLMTGNKAIGFGANPAGQGTGGGGSGGAIYTDGAGYSMLIDGTAMSANTAREGGGAIFFVVNSGGGNLKIEYSALHKNPSGKFQNAPGIFDEVNSVVTAPTVIHSSIS